MDNMDNMDLTGLIFASLLSAKKANERIDNLPLPMVFKGTLGTGGTISTLPTASSENEGFVYIVITDGTYAGQSAKAGDTFVSDGSAWVLVPSADEPSVIDDSVISTVLTWSSDKINTELDGVKVKKFTYVGNGESTNTINFPSDWKYVLHIEGMGSSDNNVALDTILINNVSPYIKTVYFKPGTVSVQTAILTTTHNSMTFTFSNSGLALNLLDSTYTVLYI